MIPLGFATPLILFGLLTLPVIWWLLRMTPPRPQVEAFPPLKILARLIKREETPSKSPWWLVLLRLTIAALVIVALAQPVWKPKESLISQSKPFILVIDNSWATTSEWQRRIQTARTLIADAHHNKAMVYIIATVEEANAANGPYRSDEALKRLEALHPQALAPDRQAAMAKLAAIAKQTSDLQIAYLSDGLAQPTDKEAFALIENLAAKPFLWYQGDTSALVGLIGLENTADAMTVLGLRTDKSREEKYPLSAYDNNGRRIGESEMIFKKGDKDGKARLQIPLEMRNDIAWIKLDTISHAGATTLVDASVKRRRIAILAPATGEMAQPLLSPLYYPAKALAPYGEIINARSGDLGQNIDMLLAAKPAVLVLGDNANIPEDTTAKLNRFVREGGTIIRFAGPNLAASNDSDHLLPVTLRRGERTLGGVMSWAAPQKIAPFPEKSPFFGLTPPDDVTISKQILPEPAADLREKSWVNLADATPLVTAETRGKGRIVFIHTAADPSWSTLPLSGFFVEMLHRIVAIANQPVINDDGLKQQLTLSPWRILSSDGYPGQAPAFVKPLSIEKGHNTVANFNNPPGLYGQEDMLFALNLLDKNTAFLPLEVPQKPVTTLLDYSDGDSIPLQGWLWGLAALLLALDSLVMLWGSGAFRGRLRKNSALSVVLVFAMAGIFAATLPDHALAQTIHQPAKFAQNAPVNEDEDNNPASASEEADEAKFVDEHDLVLRASKTHLAYVLTGNATIDPVSEAGLESLSEFIEQRTTIEPGNVVGVDIEKDELSFYPLIYWPIDPDGPMPSKEAIARIDAFMRQGGTVLFDTRDQIVADTNLDGAATPATQRLRDILAGLNIPPLEPAPKDHVISRSFYLMPDFPGLYRGAPLWVAASGDNGSNRALSAGDGISSILITGNNFAGAWAHNGKGGWMFPTVPDENMQRVWAFRGGLNIVMYMLSGNYKADQVHVPQILKRLGK